MFPIIILFTKNANLVWSLKVCLFNMTQLASKGRTKGSHYPDYDPTRAILLCRCFLCREPEQRFYLGKFSVPAVFTANSLLILDHTWVIILHANTLIFVNFFSIQKHVIIDYFKIWERKSTMNYTLTHLRPLWYISLSIFLYMISHICNPSAQFWVLHSTSMVHCNYFDLWWNF